MATPPETESSPRDPLPFTALVVMDDATPRAAALNMAIDEALLNQLEETPILRCYRWTENAVSFGCFGRMEDVRAGYPGRSFVRRWTGGGVVEHGADFTYSLLVPRSLPLATLPAMASYRCIHGVVASALAMSGVVAVEVAEGGRTDATQDRDPIPPFLQPCFSNPVPFDLLSADRKIAGGAQRRTRRGLLHQGSIQGLPFSASAHDSWRQMLSDALASGFARRCSRRGLSEEEAETARRIAEGKYAAQAWLQRR